jgi:hypothetical protein
VPGPLSPRMLEYSLKTPFKRRFDKSPLEDKWGT